MTESYIRKRLSDLTNPDALETKKFTSRYGLNHLNQIISWFEKALEKET